MAILLSELLVPYYRYLSLFGYAGTGAKLWQ